MRTNKFKSIFIISLGLFISLGMVFNSCELSDQADIQDNGETVDVSVENELYTADVFDEVIEVADEAVDLYESSSSSLKSANGFGYSRLSECVTVTREVEQGTIVMTINFGDTNCLCNDGRERRGKIIMTHEGRYFDSLVYITFSFEDFFVDDNQVVGNKSVTQTVNADSQRVSSIVIDGSLILANNGGTITYSSEKTRTIVEGSDTRTKRDDVIETTGGSTLTTDSVQVVMTILEPLVRKNEIGCFMYIIQGIMQIEKTGESVLTIDYGDGTCDNLADVTQDGVTTTIELKRKCAETGN
ncbi:MAG: hypothetical protein M0P66_06740 [Salinivirgaceae bacterium]|nr:hypothetical protein [Salinivirgaceae bacterium]